MTAELVTSTLRTAIEAWCEELFHAPSTQTYGDVQSALQEICGAARIGFNSLPSPLEALHVKIVEEFANRERGSYAAPNLSTNDLLDVVGVTLKLI